MKEKRSILLFAILTSLVAILAFLAESVYFSNFEYRFRTGRFQKLLSEKETILNESLNNLKTLIASEDPVLPTEIRIVSLAEKHNITILQYIGDSLVYWSFH